MSENALLEFLEDIENLANNELKEQECIDFLSGINELQYLSESDLKNKIEKYLPSIESNDQEIEKLISIIKNIKSPKAFFTYIGQQELTALITILLKKYNEELKGEPLLTNTGAGSRIFIAIELNRMVTRLKENPGLPFLKDEGLIIIKLIHRLGVLQGLLSGVKMVHNISDKALIHEMIRSFLSERAVTESRWYIKYAIQDKVSEIAEKLYQNGDKRYHNKMADHLYEKFYNVLDKCEKGEHIVVVDTIAKAFQKSLNILKEENPNFSWNQVRTNAPKRNGFLDATKKAARSAGKNDRVRGIWGVKHKKI